MNTQDTHSQYAVRQCALCEEVYPHDMFHQCEVKPLSMDESEQELLGPFRAEIARLKAELEAEQESAEECAKTWRERTKMAQRRSEAAEALAEKYRKLLVDSYLELRNESVACPGCRGWVAEPDNPEWREWHSDSCELWLAVKDAIEEGKE